MAKRAAATAPNSLTGTKPVPLPENAEVATFRPELRENSGIFILGDSGSQASLGRISLTTNTKTLAKTLRFLKDALKALKQNNWKSGEAFALKALQLDNRSAEGWHMLAISQEKTGQLEKALDSYEKALSIQPHNLPVASDLGRLAYQLKQLPIAEKLFSYVLKFTPNDTEAANNLATTLRDVSRFDDAIEILRSAIHYNPQNAVLWNALGTVVNAQGDTDNAIIFYNEALTHDPDMALALYNLSNIMHAQGRFAEGMSLLEQALKQPGDKEAENMCRLSLAFHYAALSQLEPAWEYYDGRKDQGTPKQLYYLINRPHWTPDMDVKGKHIFVSAEQGLGDEVMFASMLPDLLRDIGPDGHLTLAVEPRLVPLFARSFPAVTVMRHLTFNHNRQLMRAFPDLQAPETIDAWAMIAELLKKYRRTVDDFPADNRFLIPDPERVAYWKTELAKLGDGPKVGILWKSLIKHSQRDRHYSPFEQWKPILQTPGTHFINLQYGDASAELAQAEREGLRIWNPPDIDLTRDLDDLCALCCALDLVIGPPNATSNLAAAAGVRVWKFSAAHSWVRLGTDYYPWYPTVRAFKYYDFDWSTVIQDIREALIKEFDLPAS